MGCGGEEEASRPQVWLLLWLHGQLKSPAWAGWSAQRIAQSGWWVAGTKTGHWHHGRWGTAAAPAHPRRPPRGRRLQCPRVNLHLKLVQIEWMVLTLAQGMLYFSPMASAVFSLLVSSYLIASVHLELPPHDLLHSRDNAHHKKRIGIIIL